jgi:3'-5' exoribonuclease
MSLSRTNISDLVPKEDVESIFLIKHIALMDAKDGKKYLNIIFTDGTGDLEARAWNDAEEIFASLDKGQFVQVKGKVNIFQGRKQFIIKTYEKINASDVEMGDFVMKASRHPNDMYQDLMKIVNNLDDVYIKELLTLVLEDAEIKRRLMAWQAGKSIHHAYQSGLLEHILSCSQLATSLSAHYRANVNYVVAGAILHDLCKIYELTDGINIEYTEEGKLVGHLVKSLEIIDRYSYKIKDFPYQMKLHLKHIMLSHHGEYEYGSPKIPQTSEAMLVHLIDLMDSKMHSFETIKRLDTTSGHWSGFVKHLDRIIYKDELPYFPEKVSREEQNVRPVSNGNVVKDKMVNKSNSGQIKQSLGGLLKDFKVDD